MEPLSHGFGVCISLAKRTRHFAELGLCTSVQIASGTPPSLTFPSLPPASSFPSFSLARPLHCFFSDTNFVDCDPEDGWDAFCARGFPVDPAPLQREHVGHVPHAESGLLCDRRASLFFSIVY